MKAFETKAFRWTVLLIFIAVAGYATAQISVPPNQEFTIKITLQDWTTIYTALKKAPMPAEQTDQIVTKFNSQINEQLKPPAPAGNAGAAAGAAETPSGADGGHGGNGASGDAKKP